MQILIVAATQAEIQPLIDHFGTKKSFDILITGVGMVATAFAMGNYLAKNKYGLVINLGIAGSFDRNFVLGDIVEITQDSFSELGAQDDEHFISIDTLGFGESCFYPSAKLSDVINDPNILSRIKSAKATTVNTVHGNTQSIEKISLRLQPQIESMEGAAFFYAGKQAGIPCVQIRAVSNYVEKRNRDNWKIGLAIKNLNSFAIDLLEQLTTGG